MNEDFSQFFDANSQICLNEDSFVQTPQSQGIQMIALSSGQISQYNSQTAQNSQNNQLNPTQQPQTYVNLVHYQRQPSQNSFINHNKTPSIQVISQQQDKQPSLQNSQMQQQKQVNQSNSQIQKNQAQNDFLQGFQDINGMSMIEFDKNNESNIQNLTQTKILMINSSGIDGRLGNESVVNQSKQQILNPAMNDENLIKLDQIGLDIDLSNINYEKNNDSQLIVTQGEIKFEQMTTRQQPQDNSSFLKPSSYQNNQGAPIMITKPQQQQVSFLNSLSIINNNQSAIIINEEQKQNDTRDKTDNSSSVQVTPKPTTSSNTTWQKVTFTKRRSANNINNQTGDNKSKPVGSSNISQIQSKIMQKQQNNPTQIIDYDSKNTSQIRLPSQQIEMKRQKSLKTREPGEILPVFDCLFCCQEHFVLNKITERTLIVKFANHPVRHELERDKLMTNILIKKNNCYDHLSKVIVKDLDNEFQKVEKLEEEIQQMEQQKLKHQSHIKEINTSKNALKSIVTEQNRKPVVIKLAQVMKQITEQKQKQEEKAAQVNKDNGKKKQSDENQKGFFGGISCVGDSMLDQSNFLNVNLRTRRQRVLQNISFQTDFHNIYDPCYTSQESNNSVNLEDTESQHFSNDIEESESSLDEYSDEEQEEEEEEYDDEEEDEEEQTEGQDDDNSDVDEEPIEIEEEDQELKEIVYEYNRKEEELKKSPQTSKQVHYVSQEPNNDSQNNICGISSIDQQIDEEDFAGSDEDNPTPLTNNINYNNPTSFTNITGPIQSYNLNIQENPVSHDDGDEGDDEDSERYTFGCVTLKGEDEVVGNDQQKVTFSNCQGESSLSPVRALGNTLIGQLQTQLSNIENQYRLQKVNDEYFDQQSLSQGSHQKNAMLLDISPVSCNRVQRIPNLYNDGTVISKDTADQYMNIQQNDNDIEQIRAKIDFYPTTQEVDSLDIHITSVPTLQQQRSFDDSSNFITQQHFPQKSQVHFEDDSEEFPTQLPFQKQLQFSYDQKSNDYETNGERSSNYLNIIQSECQTNQNINMDQRLKIIQEKQQQSKSFTTTNTYKSNHKKLIPVQSQTTKNQITSQVTPQSIKNDQTATREVKNLSNPSFLSKEDKEKIIELFKKNHNNFQVKKTKKTTNIHNTSTGASHHHLGSFDSIKQKRVESNLAQKTGSSIDNNQGDIILKTDHSKQAQYKQKTQALCTPIDTNDNIMLTYGVNGAQSRTNKTTVNQNSRRQNSSTSGATMFLGTCKNGINSQANILLVGDNAGQLFTNRKNNEQFFSTKVPASEKPLNGKKKFQRIQDKNYMQFSEHIIRNQQNQVNKNSSMKSMQYNQSPSVMKNGQKIPQNNNLNGGMQHMSVSQLSKKDINHFLKSALCSSRYATAANNHTQFNNLFKQSIDMTSYDKTSKSHTKKKRKSKVSISKNNHTNSISDYKKVIKAKKSNKKQKISKIQQNQQEYYQQQQNQVQDQNNYLNVCNSMNFSNDYSIPSLLSNGGITLNLNQKSTSMTSAGQIDHKSSQKLLMYQSIQDGQTILHNLNMCNHTNIQDTSNNFPYSGSLQAEMSTTCISHGANSNQLLQNHNTNKINLSNIQTSQFNQHLIQHNNAAVNQSSTTNKKMGLKKQQQFLQQANSNMQVQMNKEQLQKMNSSTDEMNLFNLLSSLTIKKNPKQQKNESKNNIHKNAKLSQRGSISVQRSQNFNAQSSIEKSLSGRNTETQGVDPKHQTTNILVNNMNQMIPGHHGQFSFSQNNLKLNQTTNLNKTTSAVASGAVHRKRKSKGGIINSNTFNNVNLQVNTTSSSSTLRNTSVQAKRRDNIQRTRSTSKSNHNIKTDLPTHQLLLENQGGVPQQVLLKNKQILYQQNAQIHSLNLTNGGFKLSQNKTHINPNNANVRNKKILTTSTDQLTAYNHQDSTSQTRQTQNNSRVSNKPTQDNKPQSNKIIQFTGLTNKNYQELGQFYGTSKILMSQVTSPMRPLANNNNQLGIQQSLNLGHVNNISLGGVKSDNLHANFKGSLEKQM